MKVTLVTETFPPEINGVAMTLHRIASGLAARGWDMEIIRPRQFANDLPDDLAGVRQRLTPGVPLPFYRGLRLGLPAPGVLAKSWKQYRPDLVHIATEGPLGWMASREARALGVPVTTSFHTNFHLYGRHYGLGWLASAGLAYLRHFHGNARATFVPTKEARCQLLDSGFARVKLMKRGVDTVLFRPEARSRELRAEWGVDEETLVVGYTGRIAPEKNLQVAIDAFEAIHRRHPAARFVVVGDGPLRRKLERTHPRFIFCGTQRGEGIARHYASMDLFLFPSLTETFGNVVTEAMASGVTVVSFNRAAAREHIENGFNGLVANGDSPGPFIELALRAAESSSLRRRLGAGARQTALGITWEKVVDQFHEDLREASHSFGADREGTSSILWPRDQTEGESRGGAKSGPVDQYASIHEKAEVQNGHPF